MRIGYVMQAGVPDVRESRPSGPSIHVIHTIKELGKLGSHVRLVAAFEDGIWRSDDLVTFVRVSAPWMDRRPLRLAERLIRRFQAELDLPYIGLFDSLRFAEICRRELAGFDVLYERMGWMGWGGSFVARRLGVPHVLEINGDHLQEHEMLGLTSTALQTRLSVRYMSSVAAGAAHTVATGEGWRRRHVDRWHVDPKKTSVVQNGSEIVDLLRRDELRCYRCGPQEPGSPIRLIYVGSFDPWQNIPLLLRAVARAANSGTKVELALAGSGRLRESLELFAGELQIAAAVKFLGHLPMAELASQLAVADAGISLYVGREEFNGLKLLDYKCAGLATIAAGRDGEPSLLKDDVTGIIIPPADEDALVAAIQDLALDRERLARMGRQARSEAEQQHRWRNTAEAVDRILRSVVAAPCASRVDAAWQVGKSVSHP